MQTRLKPTSKAMHRRFTWQKVIFKSVLDLWHQAREHPNLLHEYLNYPFSEEEMRVMSCRNNHGLVDFTFFNMDMWFQMTSYLNFKK